MHPVILPLRYQRSKQFPADTLLRRLDLHMHRLRPRQLIIPKHTETNAPATVLHPRPRERRIEVVAAVQEHGASLQLVDNVEERLLRPGVLLSVRPYRRCETVGRVIHECNRFHV